MELNPLHSSSLSTLSIDLLSGSIDKKDIDSTRATSTDPELSNRRTVGLPGCRAVEALNC